MMSHYRVKYDSDNNPYLEVDQSGSDLLHNPLLSKGTAFSERERHEFGLMGLIPPHISTMQEQLGRVYENFKSKNNNIERYIHLRALQDRNETLFYALLNDHAQEMIPIIYTPTVGEAVQKGSHIYRHSRGLYISPSNIESFEEMVDNLPSQNIDVIVVTDNQGILGIGDQGIGGMGIPIGKLSLYTLGAGINPSACLPICLDVGTDNEALLDDPLYLGHKHKRYTGEAYDRFIDRFVEKITKNYPAAILQWEDFSKQNAFSNLDRYRDKCLSFNDDIQGTGAVVIAGVMGGMKIIDEPLEEQRFLVFGAGAGGIGVARQIMNSLMARGVSESEASSLIYTVDSKGLIMLGRAGLENYKIGLAKDPGVVDGWNVRDKQRITLEDVVENAKITVLLGTSGQPGMFTKSIVEKMCDNTHSPLIFPLSNPTPKAEATPVDIYKWSRGRAIVVTGSPFDDVELDGRTYRIGQGNNVFIFPGVGLGALAAKACSITNEMFTAAANRLADMMPPDARESHCVYPQISDLCKVSEHIAVAVYNTAVKQGVAAPPPDVDPLSAIRARKWKPVYLPYRKPKPTR